MPSRSKASTQARRMRQLALMPAPSLAHGGATRVGKRKIMRPVDPKRPIHVTLHSTRAKGTWSMLRHPHKARVFVIVHEAAERFDVKIHQFANVGTHLHLLVKPRTREGFQAFLRAAAGMVAFAVTGAKKGKRVGRFWDALAFSRVVNWGTDFAGVVAYIVKNILEGEGVIDRYGVDRDLKMFAAGMRAPPRGALA